MSAPDFFGLDTSQVWDTESAFLHLKAIGNVQTKRTAERRLHQIGLLPVMLTPAILCDELGRLAIPSVLTHCIKQARKKRKLILFAQLNMLATGSMCLHANDLRGSRYWLPLPSAHPSVAQIQTAIAQLQTYLDKQLTIIPHGELVSHCRSLPQAAQEIIELLPFMSVLNLQPQLNAKKIRSSMNSRKHLNQLEAESIHIIREAVAEADNPAMLYSIGKDSSVMLHLARKAFFPAPPPFPLVHVDTRWKFQEMYLFREYIAQSSGMELLVHINPEALAKDINPFEHGSALHTDITKTEGLKQALERYQFDVVFGGARRDEEQSRAKERIFSFRSQTHRWDPKNQRPELWNNYNLRKAQGESIRVFPLSNWTELDIWQYIYHEQIPVVPLYFAKERPVVVRDGMILMVDDSRMRLLPDEVIEKRSIRFRTLGCYPLSGAIESQASSIADIIVELLKARSSERQGRMIDTDAAGSMERKKQEGYF